MLFRLIYDEALAHASYLVGCQQTGEAIIFDPARDIDRYLELAASHGFRITATAETHIHADFLSGCGELARRCGAHVFVSGEGGPDWQSTWVTDHAHTILSDGDTFDLGAIRFRAMHTPGHTPEHIVYELTDRPGGDDPLGLITGDFVFVGAMGRPDLLETALGVAGAQEASARELHASARRFLDLPDFLQVWPAHGSGSACGKALGSVPQSTVGYERRTNPALIMAGTGDEQAFVSDILADQVEPPMYFARMKRLNRDGVPPLEVTPPAILSAQDCQALDPDQVTVIDLRPWQQFKACHVPGSHWSAPGAWFPASVGSYLETDQAIALLVEPRDAETYYRLLTRLGYDRVIGLISPSTFEEAAPSMDTREVAETDAMGLQQALEAGSRRIIDVRSGTEHGMGSIPGATHVPYTRLAEHLDSLPSSEGGPILVHCQGGLRSAMASTYLQRMGYSPVNVAGGYAAWFQLGLAQPRA